MTSSFRFLHLRTFRGTINVLHCKGKWEILITAFHTQDTQRWVGHWDRARSEKPAWSPRQIKLDQNVNSYLNLMCFFKLPTCIYTFWLCSTLTVIRLIGKDPRCFSLRLRLTIHSLKMCCGCVLQICWPLAKKHNVIALLIKQCIVLHSL